MTAVDHTAPVDRGPATPPPPRPDWLALLPARGVGRVAIVGPPTPAALAVVAAGTAAPPEGPADTVVVTEDRRRAVADALARVAPGGAVRIEPSRWRRRRWVRRALREAGLTEVATWWHRPTLAAPRSMVRLDDRIAAATVLRTVADRGRRASGEALAARLGLADLLSSEVAILALAPGDREPALAQTGDGRRLDGLVTPRFALSRAVIGVSTDGAGRQLHGISKLARRPEDDTLVAREADALDELVRRAGPFAGAPQDARAVRREDRIVLVEAAVAGRPLDRRLVRRDAVGALVAGRRWLDTLPRSAPTAPARDGRADALLRDPLAALAARPDARTPARADLIARAGEVLARLEDVPLPVVFEHGDLSHPNLMWQADGGLAVVDWERARPDGLPLHDLAFFVAYLTESIDRPPPAELGRAVVQALRPHGWARPELDVHAERLELDRSLVPHLQVASWTRRVAALPPRPAGDAGPPHRLEVLWAAAIDGAWEAAR